MAEIKTGEALLDYTRMLSAVVQLLDEALPACKDAQRLLENGMYQGRALDEMKQFFQYLTTHVNQLEHLYQVGAKYVMNTYMTEYENDEQLARWVLSCLAAGGANGNAVVK